MIWIRSSRLLFCIVIEMLLFVPGTYGWGKDGHYATCKIAQELLTEDAIAAVKSLLPDSVEGDLASLCSWPDEIRFHYHWSSPLHYIDTPDFKCNYDYCRMVSWFANLVYPVSTLPFELGKVLTNHETAMIQPGIKIDVLQGQLTTTQCSLPPVIMLLIQQRNPLHVGFTEDAGGNTIIVHWYRRKANLHHVWDNMIIESALKTFYGSDLSGMIQAIQRNITDAWSNDAISWEECARNQTACPDPYASESIKLTCKFAYRNATPGSTLNDDYFLSRLPIVEKRLAQGRVRLAATLNRIFASRPKIAQA